MDNIENKSSRKDPELIKIMDLIDSVDPKLTNLQKMDFLIKWKKAYRGLKGLHLTIDPFTTSSNEMIAHDYLMMERSMAEGNYKDVTNEEL